jgi:hypothetical protein
MLRTIKELYGAGILFFYYLKWPMFFGYPLLIVWWEYPRYWVMDGIWIYCMLLIVKDFVYRFILGKKHCDAKK